MLPNKFGVNWPFESGETRKIDFQDGGHGGHLGFPINMILAIFNLQDTLMFPTKYRVNWGCKSSRLLKQLLTPNDGRRTMDDARRTTDDGH